MAGRSLANWIRADSYRVGSRQEAATQPLRHVYELTFKAGDRLKPSSSSDPGLRREPRTRITEASLGSDAMPHRLCPQCHTKGRLIETSIPSTRVEYYRCDQCEHVWIHEKDDPDGPPTDVTTRPPKSERPA
jgi:hypothetical protein